MAARKTTRLSSDVTKPQPTDAGDAPADTWDPKERASSARPNKAAAAADGHLTVNAVVPVDPISDPEPPAGGGRTETYTAYDAAGKPVQISHNIDTGETEPDDEGTGSGDEGGSETEPDEQ